MQQLGNSQSSLFAVNLRVSISSEQSIAITTCIFSCTTTTHPTCTTDSQDRQLVTGQAYSNIDMIWMIKTWTLLVFHNLSYIYILYSQLYNLSYFTIQAAFKYQLQDPSRGLWVPFRVLDDAGWTSSLDQQGSTPQPSWPPMCQRFKRFKPHQSGNVWHF